MRQHVACEACEAENCEMCNVREGCGGQIVEHVGCFARVDVYPRSVRKECRWNWARQVPERSLQW